MKNKLMFLPTTVLALFLTSCTTTSPYTGQQVVSKTTVGAGVGAVSGALLGGILGGGRGAILGAAAGGIVGGVAGNTMDRQDAELRNRLQGTGVQVIKHGNYIELSMASDVTFKFNSADIRPRFYDTLSSVAIVLNKYKNTNIVVAGYTDNVGSEAYNQKLSEHRARSVANYLVAQGVNGYRLFNKGYGKRFPVANNKTEAGRAVNRRVVIELRPKG